MTKLLVSCPKQVVSLKTDVSARYVHINSFQLGLNLVNLGSCEYIRTEAVALSPGWPATLLYLQYVHNLGQISNSVTFWFCQLMPYMHK